MEKRLLLAIVLSFLVLVLYQALFIKQEPVPEPLVQPPEAAETLPLAVEPPPSTESLSSQQPVEEQDFLPVSAQGEEEISVDTSLYHAVWSNKGAVLKSWKLKEYLKDNKEENVDLVSEQSAKIKRYPFYVVTEDPRFAAEINSSLFIASSSSLELQNGKTGEIRFEFADDSGTRVEKIFKFSDGTYYVDTQINIWRNGQRINSGMSWGPSIRNPSLEAQKSRFGGSNGITVLAANKVYHLEERKYKPEQSVFNFVNWASYSDNYFAALFVTTAQNASAALIKEEVDSIPYFFIHVNSVQTAYLGPKQYDLLAEFGHNAQKLVRFGLFGFIAEILYKSIKALHKTVPNWGFCIIILTLIIKVLFFPLTYSSTKSMARMQELQPKLKALKAKYKKAKQDIAQRRKLNEETMALYKEHGVNPAGGCLPLLIQLPIFWGFFRLLVVAVEFRHSPFILWINDLSIKDPYYITPILMGVTQFISQKMTPTSADSSQQKMMLIMPVVMTIFFMNFQSGLVLYWLTNNVLQIGQQYITNKLMKKNKRDSNAKRRTK
ncbi:MAG: membrane protein insertase YidC [Candidatus Aminicenantes bacterium]|nr:membrane protein insertase YidC [Candidatus Aminicenantes bacterium]